MKKSLRDEAETEIEIYVPDRLIFRLEKDLEANGFEVVGSLKAVVRIFAEYCGVPGRKRFGGAHLWRDHVQAGEESDIIGELLDDGFIKYRDKGK